MVTLPNILTKPSVHLIRQCKVCLAVNLDVESNINISNNSRVAGMSLTQGNTVNNTYTTESHTWDNNISVIDSTVTSGSVTTLEDSGFYGNSAEPSDLPVRELMCFCISVIAASIL